MKAFFSTLAPGRCIPVWRSGCSVRVRSVPWSPGDPWRGGGRVARDIGHRDGRRA